MDKQKISAFVTENPEKNRIDTSEEQRHKEEKEDWRIITAVYY